MTTGHTTPLHLELLDLLKYIYATFITFKTTYIFNKFNNTHLKNIYVIITANHELSNHQYLHIKTIGTTKLINIVNYKYLLTTSKFTVVSFYSS